MLGRPNLGVNPKPNPHASAHLARRRSAGARSFATMAVLLLAAASVLLVRQEDPAIATFTAPLGQRLPAYAALHPAAKISVWRLSVEPSAMRAGPASTTSGVVFASLVLLCSAASAVVRAAAGRKALRGARGRIGCHVFVINSLAQPGPFLEEPPQKQQTMPVAMDLVAANGAMPQVRPRIASVAAEGS